MRVETFHVPSWGSALGSAVNAVPVRIVNPWWGRAGDHQVSSRSSGIENGGSRVPHIPRTVQSVIREVAEPILRKPPTSPLPT